MTTYLDPPDHLSEDAREVWRELAPDLNTRGILSPLARVLLEMACVHVVQHRRLGAVLASCPATNASGARIDTSAARRALRAEAMVVSSLTAGFCPAATTNGLRVER